MFSTPLRRVGVLDCFKDRRNLTTLLRAIRIVGGAPVVIRVTEDNWLSRIRNSPIRHWVVSGSEWNVTEHGAPRIFPSLLLHEHQRFLFICYGMQSLVFQMGGRISKLPEKVQRVDEVQGEGNGLFWRNHEWGFKEDGMIRGIVEPLYSSDGYFMRGFVGNAMLTQYHPERTLEGLEQMEAFLRS